MTVMASRGNVAHPFTVSDLDEMPDDGRRYELIDGALPVSPALPCYWLVDPDPGNPSLTALELSGREYTEAGQVMGDQPWDPTRPFPVRVVPPDLVRGLRH
jgi:hypothetical protein